STASRPRCSIPTCRATPGSRRSAATSGEAGPGVPEEPEPLSGTAPRAASWWAGSSGARVFGLGLRLLPPAGEVDDADETRQGHGDRDEGEPRHDRRSVAAQRLDDEEDRSHDRDADGRAHALTGLHHTA